MFCWSVDEKEWNVQNKKGAWKHGKSRKIRPRLCENFRIRGADRAFPKPVPRQSLLLENVRLPEEKKLTARISIADFKKLAPIHSKTHVRIHILEKRGLPFFLYKSWRRKCFLVGILLCALLLFWLSGRIWNIHIDGNVKNSTPQLLEFLDQQGVIHGISKKNVNCSEIAALLRKNYPDITFVSAGCREPGCFLPFRRRYWKKPFRKRRCPVI